MTITLHLVLMILAVVFLLMAALGVNPPRANSLGTGLFFWALATMISV